VILCGGTGKPAKIYLPDGTVIEAVFEPFKIEVLPRSTAQSAAEGGVVEDGEDTSDSARPGL
jgi:hypothetical protein